MVNQQYVMKLMSDVNELVESIVYVGEMYRMSRFNDG